MRRTHGLCRPLALAAILSGCASQPEQATSFAVIPAAITAGSAEQLALSIRQDLSAANSIPDSEKTALLARADILAHHAKQLSEDVDQYDLKTRPDLTIEKLDARADAVDREYTVAFREWGIWQVQHGIRKAEDLPDHFDFIAAKGK